MKAKIWFNVKFISPELKFTEGNELSTLALWCLKELKMPVDMIKAISIEKIEEVK